MSGDKKRVTIHEVARHAGVSSSTVSLVLQKATRITEATRLRVERAIADLGYRYNRGAANLRRGATEAVGLVIDDIANPFFAEFTAAVTEVAAASGLLVFLADSQDDPARQDRLIQSLAEHGVGGLVLCAAIGTERASLDRIAAWGVPCTLAVRNPPDETFDFIGLDNAAAAAIAVDHLMDLGHRRIAFLGGDSRNATRTERVGGYIDALSRRGLTFDAELVVESRPSRASGAADVRQVMALAEPPTAVIGYNDLVALSAMHGLRDHGLVPGQDVAVIGFDDIAEAATSHPPLTTVALSPIEAGRRAARTLIARIEAPDQPLVREVVRPVLVTRQSTCPAPKR